jgi:hypothetical protein
MAAWVRTLALALFLACAMAQCPEFNPDPIPQCVQRTDNELCVLAARKDYDRFAKFSPVGLLHVNTSFFLGQHELGFQAC